MTGRLGVYAALAAHLDPDDPLEGERQIDTAILALQRARYRPSNRARLAFWLAHVLLLVGACSLAARTYCWLDPRLYHGPMGAIAAAIPVWAAVCLINGAIGLLAFYCLSYRDRDYGLLPLPPRAIFEWLAAHGAPDLRHWPEIYWPYVKRLAHRKEILGFVLWRKTPLSLDQYPPVPALFQRPSERRDPHLFYLDSAEGRADRKAFYILFEQRMDDWHRLSFRFTLAMLALLLVTVWLPIFPSTPTGHWIRISVMLAFILLSAMVGLGVGTIRLRWLPAAFRHYWFRALPPEARRFCDHMIARWP